MNVAAEEWHGTVNGYTNKGCRCNECKVAWAEHISAYRARRFDDTQCSSRGCTHQASKSAGNGLCASCNEAQHGR